VTSNDRPGYVSPRRLHFAPDPVTSNGGGFRCLKGGLCARKLGICVSGPAKTAKVEPHISLKADAATPAIRAEREAGTLLIAFGVRVPPLVSYRSPRASRYYDDRAMARDVSREPRYAAYPRR
jgi:hypothetical protein